MKGIGEPLSVFRIRLGETPPASETPGRFSITVAPFLATPESQMWGEGLAGDLIAGLSRFSTLDVLSGAAVASQARYVLKSAVREAGGRFRLTAQLVESETGAVRWAERFDFAHDSPFQIQDEILERIVATVVGQLQESGGARALRKRPDALGAFDLLLQGQYYADRLDPASAEKAIAAFEQALALQPDYAPALAMLALMRLRAWALSSRRVQPAGDCGDSGTRARA